MTQPLAREHRYAIAGLLGICIILAVCFLNTVFGLIAAIAVGVIVAAVVSHQKRIIREQSNR